MTVFDAEAKVLSTEIFTQHTIADLNSDITFIVLFTQEKPLRRTVVDTNTYTHIKSKCFNDMPDQLYLS